MTQLAKRVVLRLVPAGNDVQANAFVADLCHGGDLLGDYDGVVASGLYGGENGHVLGVGQQGCCPGHGFQNVAVEIGLTAVTDPASDREHEVHAGSVHHFGQLEVAFPVGFPAVRQF